MGFRCPEWGLAGTPVASSDMVALEWSDIALWQCSAVQGSGGGHPTLVVQWWEGSGHGKVA